MKIKRLKNIVNLGLLGGAFVFMTACTTPTETERVVEVEVPVPVENLDVYGWVEFEPDGTFPSWNHDQYDDYYDDGIFVGLILDENLYGFQKGEYLGFQLTWDSNDYNWLYPFVPEAQLKADAELAYDGTRYYGKTPRFYHPGPDDDTRAPNIFLQPVGPAASTSALPTDLEAEVLYLKPRMYDMLKDQGKDMSKVRKMTFEHEKYLTKRVQERAGLEKMLDAKPEFKQKYHTARKR